MESCWSGWQDHFLAAAEICKWLFVHWTYAVVKTEQLSLACAVGIYSQMSVAAAVSQTTDPSCQVDVAPFEGSTTVSQSVRLV